MNSLVFSKDTYDDNMEKMWEDMRDTLRILTNNDYMVKFYCDEKGIGIYVIEYDYADPALGGEELVWRVIE